MGFAHETRAFVGEHKRTHTQTSVFGGEKILLRYFIPCKKTYYIQYWRVKVTEKLSSEKSGG